MVEGLETEFGCGVAGLSVRHVEGVLGSRDKGGGMGMSTMAETTDDDGIVAPLLDATKAHTKNVCSI